MAPTGNELPHIIRRESKSERRRKKEPIKHVPMIESLWSYPIILLTTWGAIIPTKEIMPKKEIHVAVIREAKSKEKKRTKVTLTPRDLALYSPVEMAFSDGARKIKETMETAMTVSIIQLSCIEALDKSPNDQ
jgi:hypothetical protein